MCRAEVLAKPDVTVPKNGTEASGDTCVVSSEDSKTAIPSEVFAIYTVSVDTFYVYPPRPLERINYSFFCTRGRESVHPLFAVKSNLLYDVALVPNIGVEVNLGKQWSVCADWFGTWLSSYSSNYFWQGYGGYLTVRRYFGAKAKEQALTGHHVGAYGLAMTYDVEWGGRGYQAARWGFGGGVEYGYTKRIGKRLCLDFTIGVGFQDGEYKEYLPMDGHYVWQSTHKRKWFGPTKAEITLKWLIGKGGKR